MYSFPSLKIDKERLESKQESRQRTVQVLSGRDVTSIPSTLLHDTVSYDSSRFKDSEPKSRPRLSAKKKRNRLTEGHEGRACSSLEKKSRFSENDVEFGKFPISKRNSKDYVEYHNEEEYTDTVPMGHMSKRHHVQEHYSKRWNREKRGNLNVMEAEKNEALSVGVRHTRSKSPYHGARQPSEISHRRNSCEPPLISCEHFPEGESRIAYHKKCQDECQPDSKQNWESLDQYNGHSQLTRRSSSYRKPYMLSDSKHIKFCDYFNDSKSKRRDPEDSTKSLKKEGGVSGHSEKVIQCPAPPLQPPTTIAQLRILLLVGLVCSETIWSTQKDKAPSHTPRLMFPCPIHSANIALLLRQYFARLPRVSYFAYYGLRSELIAQELQCMALGFADPFCGPVSSLFELDILSHDAVIISSFDIKRCDYVLRAALRPDHPCKGIQLWDPHKEDSPRWPLQLGTGLGVESRLLQLEKLFKSTVEPSIRTPHQTTPKEWAFQKNSSEPIGKSYVNAPIPMNIPAPVAKVKSFPLASEFRSAQLLQEHATPYSTLRQIPEAVKKQHLEESPVSGLTPSDQTSIEALLNVPSAMEQHVLESGAELRQLLTVPTAKHSITTRAFQNLGGSRVQQICRHGTRHDCIEAAIKEYAKQGIKNFQDFPVKPCNLIHFRRILLPHTDVSLGDCSYLDTCRHTASCRFVHYEVDLDVGSDEQKSELIERCEANDLKNSVAHTIGTVFSGEIEQRPAQWILCDIRTFDFNIIRGKIQIVMADPPWDIHMDLPYGTMTDGEMRALRLDLVQDEGCLFLWVTGRAMEVGRECMKIWGYKQVEELVWVKTNQLHRLIRTGRTGHWLNHSKEHCLVGVKGHPKLNHHLDTDIIVAEVRETSRKPDEIYRIIERLCPGPYKLELFGRPHNVRENWITLGNQLENVCLHDPDIIRKYNEFATKTCVPPFVPETAPTSAG